MRDILNYIAYPSGQSFTTDLRDNLNLTFPAGTISVQVSIELEFDIFYNLFRAWKPATINGVDVSGNYPFFKSGIYLWNITTDLVESPSTTALTIQTYGTQNEASGSTGLWNIYGQPTYTNLTWTVESSVIDPVTPSGNQVVTETSGVFNNVDRSFNAAVGGSFGNIFADSAIFTKILVNDGIFARVYSDSARITNISGKHLLYDSGIIKQFSADSARIGTIDNTLSRIGSLITNNAAIVELNGANANFNSYKGNKAILGNSARVGRYFLDAGIYDSFNGNAIEANLDALVADNFGGIYYLKDDSQEAHLKYDEVDKKWSFYPNLLLNDIDSDGIRDSEVIDKTPLGKGETGQFLFYSDNEYGWDYPVLEGKYAYDSFDLNKQLSKIPDPIGLITEKEMTKYSYFSHSYKTFNQFDGTHPEFNNLAKSTQNNFYPNVNSYINYVDATKSFDTINIDSHRTSTDSEDIYLKNSFNGVLSPKSSNRFTLSAKVSATDSFNQAGAIVLIGAHVEDAGKDYTLSLVRTVSSSYPVGQDSDQAAFGDSHDMYSYGIYYNYYQSDQQLIGREREPGVISNLNRSWENTGYSKLFIEKNDKYIKFMASDWNDSVPLAEHIISFNFDDQNATWSDLVDLSIFNEEVGHGFGFHHVSNAKITDIRYRSANDAEFGTDENTVIDLYNRNTHLWYDSFKAAAFGKTRGYHKVDVDSFGVNIMKKNIPGGRFYWNRYLDKVWWQSGTGADNTFMLSNILDDTKLPLGEYLEITAGSTTPAQNRRLVKNRVPLQRLNSNFDVAQSGISVSVFEMSADPDEESALISTDNYSTYANSTNSNALAAKLNSLRTGAERIVVLTSYGNWWTDNTNVRDAAKAQGLSKLWATCGGPESPANQPYAAIYMTGTTQKVYETTETNNGTISPTIYSILRDGEFFVLNGTANVSANLSGPHGNIEAEIDGNNRLTLTNGIITSLGTPKNLIDLDYNEPTDRNNNILIQSHSSIHNLIDASDSGTDNYWSIQKNLDPYNDAVSNTTGIFKVSENGDVDITGSLTTITTDNMIEGTNNRFYTDSRSIIAAQNNIQVSIAGSRAADNNLTWTPSTDANATGTLQFTKSIIPTVVNASASGTLSSLSYDHNTAAYTFNPASLAAIQNSLTVTNDSPTGSIASLAYNSSGGFTFKPAVLGTVSLGGNPPEAQNGTVWFDDVTTGEMFVYSDSAENWIQVTGSITSFSAIGSTPPTSPLDGTFWFDDGATGELFIYSDNASNWIQATGVVANNDGGVPSGSVIYHAANTPPTGFIKANGAAVSRSTYSDLFTAIGTTFGTGDGSTTFNVPDLRGEFMRGWDDTRGIDGSRAFGSAQVDQMEAHNHALRGNSGGGIHVLFGQTDVIAGIQNFGGGFSNSQATIQNTGGTSNSSENRPRNIALLACIKY